MAFSLEERKKKERMEIFHEGEGGLCNHSHGLIWKVFLADTAAVVPVNANNDVESGGDS